MTFFSELKRRNVFHGASVYAVVAWLLIQVVTAIEEPLGLPGWLDTAVIVLLLIGFPIALVVSWAFEWTPEGLKPSAQVDARLARQSRRTLNVAVIVVLALAVGVLVVDRFIIGRSGETLESPAFAERLSIAALPFASETATGEDAEFIANGLHDELLTRLAKIHSLKVISRTSVMGYRDPQRNIREIGRELGVANLLEGRVQRAGNMLRINVQLIDTATDEHLWAEVYDRELTAQNIFAVQGEMASSIASALQTTLSPQEVASLGSVPTRNMRAYNFYLSGNEYKQSGFDAERIRLAVQQYQRAVDADPEFALAWAALARAHLDMYWYELDSSEQRRQLARAAIDRALAIDPDLPEAHLALADYHYHGFRDYARALEELEIAAPRISETSDFYFMRGAIERRSGRFDLAIDDFERASALDPRRSDVLAELGTTYALVRDYAATDAAYARAMELAPDRVQLNWARVRLERDGDTAEFERILANPTAALGAFRVVLAWTVAILKRDYAAAHRYLDAMSEEGLPGGAAFYFLRAVARAETHELAGQSELAAPQYRLGRQQLEAIIAGLPQEEPDDGLYYVTLAIAAAGLGDRDAALAAAARARELMPPEVDAIISREVELEIALRVLIPLGEHERAIATIDELLTTPGLPVTVEGLLPSPWLDPIRDNPRFAALVERHRR